jgi:hypothetical protein
MSEIIVFPWNKNEIILNLLVFVITIILATYMLLLQSWILLIIYWTIWLLFIFLGRFMICRHCDYLGKSCPTLCMGIIAGKLYKRSSKKNFTEIKMWTFYLDVSFLVLAMIFPLIIYVYLFFREGLMLIEWFLVSIYFICGILALLLHSKSCKKCTVEGCPLRGKNH